MVKAPGEISWNRVYRYYKYNAIKKNLEFNFNIDEFKHFCSQNCFYCGSIPEKYNLYASTAIKCFDSSTFDNAWINKNGIDRKDNDIGYSLDNCLPCCSSCNYMKKTLGYEKFLKLVEKIYLHLIAKKD